MTQLPTEGNGESRKVVVSFSYGQRAVHACIKPVRVHLKMMKYFIHSRPCLHWIDHMIHDASFMHVHAWLNANTRCTQPDPLISYRLNSVQKGTSTVTKEEN